MTNQAPPLSGWTVVGGFSIYLITSLALPTLLHQILPEFNILQLIGSFTTLILIILFSQQQGIWKPKAHICLWKDTLMAILFWCASFPIATLFGSISDWILVHVFSIEPHEQLAIYYLKWATSSPFSMSVALFSILISAPIVEEILFRGIFQQWLRRFFGYKHAIFISALAFSLFHFSKDQGLSNISILLSLFILGGFLGFLYEKQQSLIAPITLHIIFNSFSLWLILT